MDSGQLHGAVSSNDVAGMPEGGLPNFRDTGMVTPDRDRNTGCRSAWSTIEALPQARAKSQDQPARAALWPERSTGNSSGPIAVPAAGRPQVMGPGRKRWERAPRVMTAPAG